MHFKSASIPKAEKGSFFSSLKFTECHKYTAVDSVPWECLRMRGCTDATLAFNSPMRSGSHCIWNLLLGWKERDQRHRSTKILVLSCPFNRNFTNTGSAPEIFTSSLGSPVLTLEQSEIKKVGNGPSPHPAQGSRRGHFVKLFNYHTVSKNTRRGSPET